jgi:sulfur carrier protein
VQIAVNGEIIELAEQATLQDLIKHMHLTGKRIAVEINLDVIPRSRQDGYILNPGDRVEIVHAIGGG